MGNNNSQNQLNSSDGSHKHGRNSNFAAQSKLDHTEERVLIRFRSVAQNIRDSKGENYLTLNKDTFNSVLVILEEFGFRKLQSTPFADRLFISLCDVDGKFVSQRAFMNFYRSLASRDLGSMTELSFNAIKSGKPGELSKEDLWSLMSESWTTAFRNLSQVITEDTQLARLAPSSRHIVEFAAKSLSKLQKEVDEVFDQINFRKNGSLNLTEFTSWCLEDRTVSARFGDVLVEVCVGLTHLRK